MLSVLFKGKNKFNQTLNKCKVSFKAHIQLKLDFLVGLFHTTEYKLTYKFNPQCHCIMFTLSWGIFKQIWPWCKLNGLSNKCSFNFADGLKTQNILDCKSHDWIISNHYVNTNWKHFPNKWAWYFWFKQWITLFFKHLKKILNRWITGLG